MSSQLSFRKTIAILPAPPGLKVSVKTDDGNIIEDVIYVVFSIWDGEPEKRNDFFDGLNISYITEHNVKEGYVLFKEIETYEQIDV